MDHVQEGDCPIEQSVHGKKGALADAIVFACILEMISHRLVAHAQDAGDLPVRLSPCGPDDAFALSIGEARKWDRGVASYAGYGARPRRRTRRQVARAEAYRGKLGASRGRE